MKIYWLSRVYADGSGRREVYGTIERLPDASLTLRGRDESPDSGEMRWAMDHDRRCLAARLGREPTNDELFDFIATEGNYSRHDRIRVHRPGDPNVIRFTEGRPYYCDEESIRESAIACFECYGEIPEVPEWTDRSRSALTMTLIEKFGRDMPKVIEKIEEQLSWPLERPADAERVEWMEFFVQISESQRALLRSMCARHEANQPIAADEPTVVSRVCNDIHSGE